MRRRGFLYSDAVQPRGRGCGSAASNALAAPSAGSMSRRMSSMCSSPTEMRSLSGHTPAARCRASSSGRRAVLAGRLMSVRVSPLSTRRLMNCAGPINSMPRSGLPSTTNAAAPRLSGHPQRLRRKADALPAVTDPPSITGRAPLRQERVLRTARGSAGTTRHRCLCRVPAKQARRRVARGGAMTDQRDARNALPRASSGRSISRSAVSCCSLA